MLTSVHPTLSLCDVIKDVKVASTKWLRYERGMARFPGWQDGYGAFTHSWGERHRLITYIKNQDEHHGRVSFRDERALLEEAGVEFEEKYML